MIIDLPFENFAVDDALAARLALRVGTKPPRLARVRQRDASVDFPPLVGKKGTQGSVTAMPMYMFKGQKLIATDTATPPGSGTNIVGLYVGAVKHFGGVLLSTVFSPNSLGNGFSMATASPGVPIVIVVEFLEDCTFSASLFGKGLA